MTGESREARGRRQARLDLAFGLGRRYPRPGEATARHIARSVGHSKLVDGPQGKQLGGLERAARAGEQAAMQSPDDTTAQRAMRAVTEELASIYGMDPDDPRFVNAGVGITDSQRRANFSEVMDQFDRQYLMEAPVSDLAPRPGHQPISPRQTLALGLRDQARKRDRKR